MKKGWIIATGVCVVLGAAVFFGPLKSVEAINGQAGPEVNQTNQQAPGPRLMAIQTGTSGSGASGDWPSYTGTTGNGDINLKLDGIEGEVKGTHQGEISLLSYAQGVSQTGTASHSGGMGAGRVELGNIVVTKRIDKATPKLYAACTKGTHIKDGYINFVKKGKDQSTYYRVKISDVLVVSVKQSHDGNANSVPLEEVTLNFSKIEIQYRGQNPDGSYNNNMESMTFDAKNNTTK